MVMCLGLVPRGLQPKLQEVQSSEAKQHMRSIMSRKSGAKKREMGTFWNRGESFKAGSDRVIQKVSQQVDVTPFGLRCHFTAQRQASLRWWTHSNVITETQCRGLLSKYSVHSKAENADHSNVPVWETVCKVGELGVAVTLTGRQVRQVKDKLATDRDKLWVIWKTVKCLQFTSLFLLQREDCVTGNKEGGHIIKGEKSVWLRNYKKRLWLEKKKKGWKSLRCFLDNLGNY